MGDGGAVARVDLRSWEVEDGAPTADPLATGLFVFSGAASAFGVVLVVPQLVTLADGRTWAHGTYAGFALVLLSANAGVCHRVLRRRFGARSSSSCASCSKSSPRRAPGAGSGWLGRTRERSRPSAVGPASGSATT
ncbi:hypothetical protein [Saccharopolyspora griseoalba]|uniref:Uncharacterized protein n=1 Tax=Saccharopolyspora griseoalba TaxID=1431848 RepID=A0ABW2LPB0_9PSEU